MRSATERLAILAASSALGLAALVALAGCTSAPTPRPSSAAPTTAPVFASEEEALAAAEEAYSAYQAMSDIITSEGGSAPERIEPFATDSYYPLLLEGFESYKTRNIYSIGASQHDTVSLTSVDLSARDGAVVDMYLCSDVSGVRLMNADGADITSPTRLDRIPLQVTFMSAELDPSSLLIGREDVWTGTNFCSRWF